jgi:hypothetical protein
LFRIHYIVCWHYVLCDQVLVPIPLLQLSSVNILCDV